MQPLPNPSPKGRGAQTCRSVFSPLLLREGGRGVKFFALPAAHQKQQPPPRDREAERHRAAEYAAVEVHPEDVQRDQAREPPLGAAPALVIDDAHHRPPEERDGEHVRPDEVVERADAQHTADDHERDHRPHAALNAPSEDERVEERHARREAEEHRVEPAVAVRDGHQHFRAPLLGHPLVAFEGVTERVGLRDTAIEDDLADLDVPQRAGVVEPAVAERDHQAEPREQKEERFRSKQPFHAHSC